MILVRQEKMTEIQRNTFIDHTFSLYELYVINHLKSCPTTRYKLMQKIRTVIGKFIYRPLLCLSKSS